MSTLSFVVAILPVIIIGLYIYKKDNDKESSGLLVRLFSFGIISCFPAVILGLMIGGLFPDMGDMTFIQMLLYVFLSIALVEESCKWFFLYRISYNHDEFDTFYDMIVYSSFVALGFACFENILYVSDTGIMTGLIRAVSAVPGHVCDGILMGFYLALAKINSVRGNKKIEKKFKMLSLVIPVITHGIYDFCLFWGSDLFIIFFSIFVIGLYILCVNKVKNISKDDIKFKYNDNYCTNCGMLISSRFCTGCGKENK